MEKLGVNWGDGDGAQPTSDPGVSVSMLEDEVPTLTVAAVVGVTAVVLIAIAAVFLLGVLIDWRQQRMLEKRMGQVKKLKNHRRVNMSEGDSVDIADNMEETGISIAPAEVLRNVP